IDLWPRRQVVEPALHVPEHLGLQAGALEQSLCEFEALVVAAGGRLRWRVQAAAVRAALLEADGVGREDDVAAAPELEGGRLLRIAGEAGHLALAEVILPGVLMVGKDPGPAFTRRQVPRHKQVGGYPLAGLDAVADPFTDDVAEIDPLLDARIERRQVRPATE